ncbi:hypothetical protein B0H11DRAFT_1914766 [Mycena galericulata]|nr:hypothetical protein B0H11DRAFT_1914766 [Mycena galericulata]
MSSKVMYWAFGPYYLILYRMGHYNWKFKPSAELVANVLVAPESNFCHGQRSAAKLASLPLEFDCRPVLHAGIMPSLWSRHCAAGPAKWPTGSCKIHFLPWPVISHQNGLPAPLEFNFWPALRAGIMPSIYWKHSAAGPAKWAASSPKNAFFGRRYVRAWELPWQKNGRELP